MPTLASSARGAAGATPDALLRARVRTDGARPLLTCYDDVAGKRTELSAVTLDNWVAKTANLLQDELGAGEGSTVAADLPAHWLGAVWALACWSLGAALVPPGEPADVAVTSGRVPAPAGELVRVDVPGSPAPEPGTPCLPAGSLDYLTAVPSQGDRFVPVAPLSPALPALLAGRSAHTLGGLVELARRSAADLGVGPRGRVLTDAVPTTLRGALEVVLLPLVAGASAVLVRADPTRAGGAGGAGGALGAGEPRWGAERVTHDLRA